MEREVSVSRPTESEAAAWAALEGFAAGGCGLVALEFPVRDRRPRASEVRRDGLQPLSCMKVPFGCLGRQITDGTKVVPRKFNLSSFAGGRFFNFGCKEAAEEIVQFRTRASSRNADYL